MATESHTGPILYTEHLAMPPLALALVALAVRAPWSWPAATTLVSVAMLIAYSVAVRRRRAGDG